MNNVGKKLDKSTAKKLTGKNVLFIFVVFFLVIFGVNFVFISAALKTHSGVVTEDAYKKGVAYNDLLERARTQPEIEQKFSLEKNRIDWFIADHNGAAIDNAKVHAYFMWPVKKGYDFDVPLETTNHEGHYWSNIDLPLAGRWRVKLTAHWDDQEFHASHNVIINE